jgi:Mn-dependent DtxR family transcriptional regulator
MITHEHYGAIILTAKGKAVYEEIKFKHDSIKLYLTKILGVSDETADKDACAMEHIISEETFSKIQESLNKFSND